MNIQTRKLSELKNADYNPRKKLTPLDPEYQKIARSVDEFGYVDPIIINSDNTIIGGHQRATVLKDKGWDEVQVVVLDISKVKEKALNIALNKISGEWDMSLLKDLLTEIDDGSYDVTLTGFDMDEIEDLMTQFHQDDPVEDDGFDAVEAYEEIEEPETQTGDIWFLGKHRLMCGNSCDSADVAKLMGDEKAQLIVTDPPYNVDYKGTAGKIINDNMSNDAFYLFLFDAFKNMYAHAEQGAAIYIFHADSEGLNFRKAYQDAGFMLKQCLIWVKNALVLGRQDYQWRHEPILYGWKDGAAHYFVDDRSQTTVIDASERPNFKQMKKDELLEYITKHFEELNNTPQTIIYCDKPTKSEEYPTMKPIPLVGKLINNSSKVEWIVLDLFAGSGTTMVACEKLDRVSRIMEMDPKYADVIVKRYVKLTGDTSCYCISRKGDRLKYSDVFGD